MLILFTLTMLIGYNIGGEKAGRDEGGGEDSRQVTSVLCLPKVNTAA